MEKHSRGGIRTLVLAAAMAGIWEPVAGAAPLRPLVLHVGNEAGVPTEILNGAKAEVVRIYRDAGVEVTWDDVPGTAVPKSGPVRLYVMIVPPSLGTRMAVNPAALGVAVTSSNTRGRLVYVFYDRVETVAARAGMVVGQVLGHAIAHEVGHLLLPQGHSPTGLMRDYWTKEDLNDAALGRLLFTDEQARQIRTRLSIAD